MMPDPNVEMEEGEVTITSQKPRMARGRGMGNAVMDKVRSVAQNFPRDGKGLRAMMDKVRPAMQAKKKPFKSGGSVKSGASKRGDGCATKGKTKGRMI
jgi:hypothetical protein